MFYTKKHKYEYKYTRIIITQSRSLICRLVNILLGFEDKFCSHCNWPKLWWITLLIDYYNVTISTTKFTYWLLMPRDFNFSIPTFITFCMGEVRYLDYVSALNFIRHFVITIFTHGPSGQLRCSEWVHMNQARFPKLIMSK